MVSNKNRKTMYQHLQVHKIAVNEFIACQDDGETMTDTLLKLVRSYKNKEALTA